MNETATQRRRPRVSLLSLLLLVSLLASATMTTLLWREIGPLRAEVRRLRDETGQLTIDDPQRTHVIQVPTEGRDPQRYRVYLPAGRRYAFCYQANRIPRQGTPPANGGSGWLDPGEWIVSVRLEPMQDAKTGDLIPYLNARFYFENVDDANQKHSYAVSLGERDNEWIDEETGSATYSWQHPGRETESSDPTEALVLYRARAHRRVVTQRHPDGRPSIWKHEPYEGDCDGFMIWIEPAE